MAIEITGYGTPTIGDFPQAIVTALNEQGLFDSVTLTDSVIECVKNGVTILSLGYGSGGKFTVKNTNDTQLWTYDLGTPTVGTLSKCGSNILITQYNTAIASVNCVTTIAVGKSVDDKIFIIHHGLTSRNEFLRTFVEDGNEVIVETDLPLATGPYTRISGVCAYSAENGVVSAKNFFRNFTVQSKITKLSVSSSVQAITPLQFSLEDKNFLTNGYYSIIDDQS